jgi:hypothetical protein
VTQRITADSAFGQVTRWTIEQNGSPRTYAEGIGRVDIAGQTILPLDVPSPKPSAAPRIAVDPYLVEGEPTLAAAAQSQGISVVRAPGHDPILMYQDDFGGQLDLQAGGRCLRLGAASATRLVPVPGKPFARTGPDTCAVMEGRSSGINGPQGTYVGAHASGAFVEPDGTISWIARSFGGLAAHGTDFLGGSDQRFSTFALVPGASGGVDMVYRSRGRDGIQVGGRPLLYGGPSVADVDLQDTWYTVAHPIQFVSPITTDAGDRHTLLFRTLDHMLWLGRVSAQGSALPVQVGRLAGTLSVQTTEKGTEILRVTSDGQIDRLHVVGDEVLLEPLAWVQLPPRTLVEGAFVLHEADGDYLLVAGLAIGEGNSGMKLYRSRATVAAAAARQKVPPAVSLTAAGGHSDYLVCLPAGPGGVTTAGWRLGAAPVGAAIDVPNGRRCVLAVRGPQQVDVERPLAFLLTEGNFPGYGRVIAVEDYQHSQAFSYRDEGPQIFAPLTGGGVVHPSALYSRGFVPVSPLVPGPIPQEPDYSTITSQWPMEPVPDAQGRGLWGQRGRLKPVGAADFVRFGSPIFHQSLDGPHQMQCASQRGGVIVQRQPSGTDLAYRWLRVAQEGVYDLGSLAPDAVACTELADGTLCGEQLDPDPKRGGRRRYFCRSPDNVVRSAPAFLDPVSGYEVRCAKAVVLADNSMLIGNAPQIVRVDTATMQSAVYMEGPLTIARGTDGSAWGFRLEGDSDIALYALEVNGPRKVTSPGEYKMPIDGLGNYQLIVEDEVIVVMGGPILLTFVRIPRAGL